MTQLEMLWEYQNADMETDRVANQIRRSPNRIKLIESRDFLKTQQDTMKKIEADIANMSDRVDVITDAMTHCQEQLSALEEKFAQTPPASQQEVTAFMTNVKKLLSAIAGFEQELKVFKKEASNYAVQQQKIRRDAAKVKAEFDALKVTYDAEFKEAQKELDAKKAVAAKKAEGIDKELMEKYLTIKKHVSPVVAKLVGNQCGGCNTILPGAVLRTLKDGNSVECENCSRLIVARND